MLDEGVVRSACEQGYIENELEKCGQGNQFLHGGGCLQFESFESEGLREDERSSAEGRQKPVNPIPFVKHTKRLIGDPHNDRRSKQSCPLEVPGDHGVIELGHFAHGDLAARREERSRDKKNVHLE